jgi:hypothetical protein
MPKLSDLLVDKRFSKAQRDHVNKQITLRISKGKNKRVAALRCLRELWVSYDYDGISGRSLRACILEEILQLRESHFEEEVKQLLAILVAIYHDVDYLNRSKWYDYEVTITTLPLEYRILLLSAATALGIEDLPTINADTDSIATELVAQCKEKRRAARGLFMFGSQE